MNADRRGAASPRPTRRRAAGLAELATVALLLAASAPLRAQEKKPPTPPEKPAAAERSVGEVRIDASSVSEPKPVEGTDEFEVAVETLHLTLPDRNVELRADRAVLWGDRDLLLLLTRGSGGRKGEPLHVGPTIPTAPDRDPLRPPSAGDPETALRNGLKEIYAEGHVFFQDGDEHVVFADRVYQHLLERRGIVVDCDLFAETEMKERKTALYQKPEARKVDLRLRAKQLRLFGTKEAAASDAEFTTCRYGNPHYHVHANAISVKEETDEDLHTAPVVALSSTTLNVADVPVLPMPDFAVSGDEGQTLPLQRVHTGHSTRYGAFMQTVWGGDFAEAGQSLTEAFDLSKPLKVGWESDLDGYSARGLGLGQAFHWKAPGLVQGEMGGYWIRDHADHDQETPFVIDNPDRGRAWLRDRYNFAQFWQFDAEVSYLSDEGFQPEYFEREFKEEKEPESYGHLVRQEDNTRFGFLYMNRLNSFQSQIDTLPGADLEQIGQPLMKLELPGWLERDHQPNYLVLSHFESVGNYRDHPADSDPAPAERVVRADSQLELSTTLPVGPASIRPFAGGEFTGWDRNANDNANIGRAAGSAGARGELEIHRNFDAFSPLLGIDGLRHIVLFEADYVNVYDVSKDPSQLVPIDTIDQVKPLEEYLLAIRQRAQTHRGKEMVNVLDLDVELPIFPHAERDNPVTTPTGIDGQTYGPLHVELHHRPYFETPWLKSTTLFAETDWNLHEHRFTSVDLGVALTPSPEWTTLASWLATPGVSRTLTAEIDYRLTDKWAVAVLEQYDFFQGSGLEHRYELRRIGDDFTFALGFERDVSAGNTSFTIAIYPNFLGNRAHKSFVSGRGDAPGLDPNPF